MLTITKRWPPLPAPLVLPHILHILHPKLHTFSLGKLRITLTNRLIGLIHSPLLQTAMHEVFTKKNVDCSVDCSGEVVADEDEGVEAFEDHADFLGGEPAVCTVYFVLRLSA